jgi:hypothetical protein
LSYAIVAAVYTWPLVLRPFSHFPGFPQDHDAHAFLWNNWFIAHALWQRQSPLHTSMIFAPFGADLRLHTFGLLYGLISSPAIPLIGTVSVLSIQTLATPVLNGIAIFVLVSRSSGRRDAGFLAGLLFAATPAINFHLTVGRTACAAIWPLVWAMSAMLDVIDKPSARSIAWLAVWLLAMLLVDQQIAMYGAIWLSLLGARALFSGRLSIASARAIAIACVVVSVPFVWLYVRPLALQDYTVPGVSEALVYSYPLSLPWRPAIVWRAYGLVLPLTFLAAAWHMRRDRTLIFWWVATAVFVILTLGPAAHVFSVLRLVPGFAQFRTPYRFQMAAAIGLAVMTGLLMARASRRAVAIVACVAVLDLLAYRARHPVGVQSMPDEPVYSQIAADPADRVVLEVPFGVRTGTDQIGDGEIFTFYQPRHGKRLINGLVGRGPLQALDYYRRSPALMFLANLTPPPGNIGADLQAQITAIDVGYIVVHTDRMERAWAEQTIALVRALDAVPLETGRPETIAFRLNR